MKTLIIGGVAGGASAAARLRRLKEDEEIILAGSAENMSPLPTAGFHII